MKASDLDVVVIGAGAAGLAAARELQRAGRSFRVLDAGDRPGGVMRSERAAGHLFERGPNTFQVKAPARAFLERHGLVSSLVAAAPASRRRFVYHGGRLEPVPMGPGAFLRTPLLSGRAKLRLLAEPFVRRGDPGGESVAEFVTRRFGREVTERLAGPALTGIYAGDENELGAEAVLGVIAELERERGSVVRGAIARALRRRGGERGLPGSHSAPDGLGGLARALAGPLGEALELGSAVVALARDGAGYTVETSGPAGGGRVRARRVVLAVPAPAAAGLVASLDADAAAELRDVAYVPIVSISVSFDPAAAREPTDGFGFLVPRESGLRLLGCLFMSRLFAGRAPDGRVLATCMLGGARWPAAIDEPDDALASLLARELEQALGLRATPTVVGVTRWTHAVAQPGRRHGALVAGVRRRLAASAPGVVLAGSYLDGVSLADTLACGARAGEQVAGA